MHFIGGRDLGSSLARVAINTALAVLLTWAGILVAYAVYQLVLEEPRPLGVDTVEKEAFGLVVVAMFYAPFMGLLLCFAELFGRLFRSPRTQRIGMAIGSVSFAALVSGYFLWVSASNDEVVLTASNVGESAVALGAAIAFGFLALLPPIRQNQSQTGQPAPLSAVR